MQEYIDRYEEFANYISGHGILVIGHDHLGQGRTVSSENDFGYFGKETSDFLAKDMHTLRQQTQLEYPNLPYFMLGHSMGSHMLRKYLCLHGAGLSGAIIMGTGYMKNGTNRMGLLLDKMITLFRGERYRSPLMAKLTTGSGPYAQFNLDGTQPENSWLTKDTEIVRKYYQSKFCTYTYTLNGYKGLLESVLFDNTYRHIKKMDMTVLIYLVSGSDDPVGDLGKGVQTVCDLFRKAGVKDLEMRWLFEGDRHEILNEMDRHDTVYPAILTWLEKHV